MFSDLANRWLGVGLAAVLAVVTLGLTITGRLQLYINPSQAWFAVGMSVLLLAGAALSFALPLGAERDDHGHDHAHDGADGAPAAVIAATVGGVLASGVAVAALVLPPATLSAELAMERDTGAPVLFAGADEVQLGVVDTADFGVGDWSAVFATATSPERYAGETVRLTGFVTPADDGSVQLSRLVITHCVIDAQSAVLPVADGGGLPADLATGEWIELVGDVAVDDAGGLVIEAASVARVDEPEDPYEY
ncbi:TIGR03943 family protein [Microbacterium sp. ZXX196]|uniref:TIGR03943 family putative permease subunit n=1 Tax=Microbacterium sp. ZXX196 TaxID=2609291 RepID=UPI0012B9E247|nr:TIGR03943 family protein [Microbacterium sp. ZXX196]MTE24480.1 TIGR03943 family protein [Microbacterium sp. ZXX196]